MGKVRTRNKLVYGVGVNDADYLVYEWGKVDGKQVRVWVCPFYNKWVDMIKRCYSEVYQERQPTYLGCSVCEDWLVFSNFRKWMSEQNYEGMQLDKDLLVENNKVYSPETCIFIPAKVNLFTGTCASRRGKHPIGVNYMKKPKRMVNELSKPFISELSVNGKKRYLGCFATPEEAHQTYLKSKLKQCEDLINEFKKDKPLHKGLLRIRDKIIHHIENNLELTSF